MMKKLRANFGARCECSFCLCTDFMSNYVHLVALAIEFCGSKTAEMNEDILYGSILRKSCMLEIC